MHSFKFNQNFLKFIFLFTFLGVFLHAVHGTVEALSLDSHQNTEHQKEHQESDKNKCGEFLSSQSDRNFTKKVTDFNCLPIELIKVNLEHKDFTRNYKFVNHQEKYKDRHKLIYEQKFQI